MSQENQLTREQGSLRLGAACLIVGSVLVIIFRILHGDLPADQGGGASLSYVASYPIYPLVHLVDALGFLIFAGGLFLLSGSLADRAAWAVGRLGASTALIAVVMQMSEHLADGYALASLAHRWAAAPAVDRPTLEFGAELALAMLGGLAAVSLGIIWGVTLALFGLAVKREGYSASFAWTGLSLGILIFAMGLAQYLSPNIFPGFLLYGVSGLAAHLWAIALGIAMWRRTGRAPLVHP